MIFKIVLSKNGIGLKQEKQADCYQPKMHLRTEDVTLQHKAFHLAQAVNCKTSTPKNGSDFKAKDSRASCIRSRDMWSTPIKNAKIYFVPRIKRIIAFYQAGSRSVWSIAKFISQNFCQSTFPSTNKQLWRFSKGSSILSQILC